MPTGTLTFEEIVFDFMLSVESDERTFTFELMDIGLDSDDIDVDIDLNVADGTPDPDEDDNVKKTPFFFHQHSVSINQIM